MTIIIKSNKIASRNVGNVHGYNGPSDYVGMLDFNTQEYFSILGGVRTDYSLENSISVDRARIAEASDSAGVRKVAANGEARLQYVASMGLQGLLSEALRTNRVPTPIAPPASQVVPLPAASTNELVALSIWGGGNGDLVDASLTLLAELPFPGGRSKFYARSVGTALSPALNLTGSVERVQVEGATGGALASTFILGTAPFTRPAEIIKLKAPFVSLLSSGTGMMVGHYLHADTPMVGGNVYSGSLYARKASEAFGGTYLSHSVSAAVDSNSTHSLVTLPAGSAPAVGTLRASAVGPWKRNQVFAMGLNSAGDFQLIGARQKAVATGTGVVATAPDEIGINGGSGITGAGGGVFSGVLVRLVVYSRLLSTDELDAVASAWL